MQAGHRIDIELTASDFKGNNYTDTKDDALVRAVKRLFPDEKITSGGDKINIGLFITYHFSTMDYNLKIFKKLQQQRKNKKAVHHVVTLWRKR